MKAWYVFRARARCEDRASAALKVPGLITCVPRTRVDPSRQGEPLFPSYLSVYGDMAAAGMAQMHDLPGSGEIIAFGGEPAQVPQPVITWLQTQGGEPSHAAVASSPQPAVSNLSADWQRVLQGPTFRKVGRVSGHAPWRREALRHPAAELVLFLRTSQSKLVSCAAMKPSHCVWAAVAVLASIIVDARLVPSVPRVTR